MTLTLVAFAGGAVLGAALMGPTLATPQPEREAPRALPRLDQGASFEITNGGRQAASVELEVTGEGDAVVFKDAFQVGPGGTVRRNLVNLLEGRYDVRLAVDRDSVVTDGFSTRECAGPNVLRFRFEKTGGVVSVQSPDKSCR